MKQEPQISQNLAAHAHSKGIQVYNSDNEIDCTPYQLQAELREKNIHINPYRSTTYNKGYWIGKITQIKTHNHPNGTTFDYEDILLQGSRKRFGTYEEALEYGLLKAIDFITP